MDIAAHGTSATTSSYLTAWAAGAPRPAAASMYYTHDNAPRSNTVVVPVGSNGSASIYNYTGTTSVTAQVQGYFTSGSDENSTGGFVALQTPTRIANTATGQYVPDAQLGVGQSLDIQVIGRGGIPSEATAIFANIEARNATALGQLQVGPGGSSLTGAAAMFYGTAGPYDSGATVKLDTASGKMRITNSSGSPIDLKVDVQGYFTSDTSLGGSFHPLTPTNVYSTATTALQSKETRAVKVAGVAGLPSDGSLGAVVLTANVKNWTAGGTVTVFNSDIAWPGTTNASFNYDEGEPTNGMSSTLITAVSRNGYVSLYNTSPQPVSVTLSTQGWFSVSDLRAPVDGRFSPCDGGCGMPLVVPAQALTYTASGSPNAGGRTLLYSIAIRSASASHAPVYSASGVQSADGRTWSANIPETALDAGGKYEVRAIVSDGRVQSPSPWQAFSVRNDSWPDDLVPVPGARVLDTANAVGTTTGALSDTSRVVVHPADSASIPDTATAVYANVQLAGGNGVASNIEMGSATQTDLSALAISYRGTGKASRALSIPLDANGDMAIRSASVGASVDVVVDVLGYVVPVNGSDYFAAQPTTLFETAASSALSAGETRQIDLTSNGIVPSGSDLVAVRLSAKDWTSPGNLTLGDGTATEIPTTSLTLDDPAVNMAAQAALVQPATETDTLFVTNNTSGPVGLRILAVGWYVPHVDEIAADPEGPAAGTSTDATIQAIMDLEGGTAADVTADVNAFAQTGNLSFSDAAQALLDGMRADADQVGAEAVNSSSAARSTSSGDGGRITMPRPNHYGDIVYAPNVTSHLPHGHAAIFSNWDNVIQAPGGPLNVIESSRARAKSFAPGAKMMSVYTDNGDGPLVSLTRRKKAISWSRSRIGDKYRNFSSPNASVVTGKVGSSGSKQNCSQLVWAAYKVATGYNMNPIQTATILSGVGAIAADKAYVLPHELVDASWTHVYKTVS